MENSENAYVVAEAKVIKDGEERCRLSLGGFRLVVDLTKIDPEKWRLLGLDVCDPDNLGTSGQMWGVLGIDGNPVVTSFSYDRPDANCPPNSQA